MHLNGSLRHALAERALQAETEVSLANYLQDAQFWFESFQNWHGEFMAVVALVVLSIWLRQKDSPQSKPLQTPHNQTGV